MCVPVESDPVPFESGRQLRSSFLQRLHEVLLDERSELRRTLPGTDGLLQRHQTGHIALLCHTDMTRVTVSVKDFIVNPTCKGR